MTETFFFVLSCVHLYAEVYFFTAYATVPEAVMTVKAGALDYLAKPFDGRELIKKQMEYSEKSDPSAFFRTYRSGSQSNHNGFKPLVSIPGTIINSI